MNNLVLCFRGQFVGVFWLLVWTECGFEKCFEPPGFTGNSVVGWDFVSIIDDVPVVYFLY